MKKAIFLSIFLGLVMIPSLSFAAPITQTNILKGINKERITVGLIPLKQDKILDKVAQDKLKDLIQYNYWNHVNPVTGATPWTWFVKESYPYINAGENLARNFTTSESTLNAWFHSPTHYANIIKKEYTKTGIAINGSLIVQVFSN